MSKIGSIACGLLLLAGSTLFGQEWGTLDAQFVLDGAAPTPAKIKVDKDGPFCGIQGLVDEGLVVSKEGGIAHIVVWLSPKAGTKVAVHADYEKTAGDKVKLDNAKCRFEPRVVVMRTSQKLEITNSDPVGHNTKGDFFANTAFNDIIPSGGSITKTLPKSEANPATLSCSIHPWMSARLVVRDDPYAAASDKDGKLKIENLPVGKWTFTVWQESAGFVTKANVAGKAVEWKKGKWDVEIKAGANNVGTIKVPVTALIKKKP